MIRIIMFDFRIINEFNGHLKFKFFEEKFSSPQKVFLNFKGKENEFEEFLSDWLLKKVARMIQTYFAAYLFRIIEENHLKHNGKHEISIEISFSINLDTN
jgi:hypothetical protein